MTGFRLIPVVTEKSMRLAGDGVYTFAVPDWATKHAVARVVEQAHKVTVLAVNITRRPGKPKRRGLISGHTSPTWKALVRLKAGQRIKGFEVALGESEHDHEHESKTDATPTPAAASGKDA
ncbi:50S ribosomal protein L23 [Candidatus Berkelbacteria bacterium]|nr:50S ribosomal protein L23 [Candidatus Berkelbacteria bacterium]